MLSRSCVRGRRRRSSGSTAAHADHDVDPPTGQRASVVRRCASNHAHRRSWSISRDPRSERRQDRRRTRRARRGRRAHRGDGLRDPRGHAGKRIGTTYPQMAQDVGPGDARAVRRRSPDRWPGRRRSALDLERAGGRHPDHDQGGPLGVAQGDQPAGRPDVHPLRSPRRTEADLQVGDGGRLSTTWPCPSCRPGADVEELKAHHAASSGADIPDHREDREAPGRRREPR